MFPHTLSTWVGYKKTEVYRQLVTLNETMQHFDVNPAAIDAFQILVTNGTYAN